MTPPTVTREDRERAAFRAHGDHSTWPDAVVAWIADGGEAPSFNLRCAVEDYTEVREAAVAGERERIVKFIRIVARGNPQGTRIVLENVAGEIERSGR